MSIDRRDFLRASLAGLGGIGVAACVDSTPLLSPGGAPRRDLDSAGVRVRRNIYCLNEGSPDVQAYRAGVAVMKGRKATDGRSWTAQANIHGTQAPILGMIYNECEHGTLFFLSWHRMYLHYFERIVCAASGQAGFALPFWGYTPTGQRNLPAPFRPIILSTSAATTNVLYVAEREQWVNDGFDFDPSSVSSATAMALVPFSAFSNTLEGTPHGAVHVAIGGWMGLVSRAANDPIFFLHHANIDRIWSAWLAQGGGRANPTDSWWLTRTFPFYDEYGSKVLLTGQQVLDTAAQLDYRYDSVSCSSISVDADVAGRSADPRENAIAEAVGRRAPRSAPLSLARAQERVTLGASPVEVRVRIPAAARAALRALPDDPRGGNDVPLGLEGIELLQPSRIYYEVYANLEGSPADAVYTSPSYVGNLVFFGIGEGPHGAHGASRRLSLLPAYSRLRSRGRWAEDVVRLTFVPRAFQEGRDPASVLTGPQATVELVELRIQ